MPFSNSLLLVRDIVAITVLIPLLGLPNVAARVNESLQGTQIEATLTTKQIIAKVSASLVSVESLNPRGDVLATGSGFFLRNTNRVVTNLHVLKRATSARVKILNRQETFAVTSVYSIDWVHDLCILELAGASAPGLELATSVIAVGDDILVAGNPKGLEGSFSRGIVSAVRKAEGLLQIDAAISPGSSGGPVVDSRGDVVGVAVSSLVGGQNLNFAVPVEFLAQAKPMKADVTLAGSLAVSDVESRQLKGPVRSVHILTASIEQNVDTDAYVEKAPIPDERWEFDEAGKWLRYALYSTDGRVSLDIEYRYGESGLWEAIVTTNSDGTTTETVTEDRALLMKRQYRQFSITQSYSGIGSRVGFKLSITYDDFGHETVREESEPGKPPTRQVSTYDTDGTITELKEYSDGTLKIVRRYVHKFDHRGNWIERLETIYLSEFPSYGFTPQTKLYREIRYF